MTLEACRQFKADRGVDRVKIAKGPNAANSRPLKRPRLEPPATGPVKPTSHMPDVRPEAAPIYRPIDRPTDPKNTPGALGYDHNPAIATLPPLPPLSSQAWVNLTPPPPPDTSARLLTGPCINWPVFEDDSVCPVCVAGNAIKEPPSELWADLTTQHNDLREKGVALSYLDSLFEVSGLCPIVSVSFGDWAALDPLFSK